MEAAWRLKSQLQGRKACLCRLNQSPKGDFALLQVQFQLPPADPQHLRALCLARECRAARVQRRASVTVPRSQTS
jgi:hypothetical protein